MERLKIAVALILILISGILAAGCTFPSPAPGIPAGTTTAPTTPAAPPSVPPPMITQVPDHVSVDCNRTSPSGNGKPFITINPVPHHYFGDSILFDGTTNLQPGEMIRTGIMSGQFTPCRKSSAYCHDSVAPCCDGISEAVPVTAGTCGINTWSWDVNTSLHGFAPDREYTIYVNGRDERVNNFSSFTVSGIPQPNITLNLPENDPDEYAILLSGQVNTGNGPDEELLLIISTDSGRKASYRIPISHNESAYYWNFTLKKSGIVPYNFFTVRVSSATRPAISIERTFLYNNEPQFYPYKPYGP